jgi:hypothetical protein
MSVVWEDYGAEAFGELEDDFLINNNKNLDSNYQHATPVAGGNTRTVPLSKGIRGPANLRGRTSPYVSTRSGKPDEKTT